MDSKEKVKAETADVKDETAVVEQKNEAQESDSPQPDEITVEILQGEIVRLADKILEIFPDSDIRGATLEGVVDTAVSKLDNSALRIIELEDALAKAKADNDNAAQKIAKLEAGIAPAADPIPEIEIKRPKVGTQLKLPKKLRDADKVVEAFNDGDLFQVVLADAASQVLPAINFVGGQSILTASGDGDDIRLTLIEPIEIDSSNPHASIREAWLLDVNGAALSKCRLAVDLVGGGGLTAAIPAKSLVFNFEQPAD